MNDFDTIILTFYAVNFNDGNPFDMSSADFSGINSLGYCYLADFSGRSTFGFGSASVRAGSASAAVIEDTPDEPQDVWSSHDVGLIGTWGCPMIYKEEGLPDARPSVFMLRDMETNTILYMGRLLDAGDVEASSWECSYGLVDLVTAM